MSIFIDIGVFHEVLLPTANRDRSVNFYEALGYQIVNETNWGLIQLQRNQERLSLLPAEWWGNVALGYMVSHKDDLVRLREQLKTQNIRIEDEIEAIPPRLAFYDPSGNEFQVLAQNS